VRDLLQPPHAQNFPLSLSFSLYLAAGCRVTARPLLLLASPPKPTDGVHFLIWLLAAAGRKSVNGFFPFSTEF
jgi:hypothetical protein